MYETQALAARVVARVLAGKNLNLALSEIEITRLQAGQRAALQDMAYGTLRFYGRLRAILQMLLVKPIKDDVVYTLTLVALYQLNYARAADYTVVANAVQACVSLQKTSAKSLVNAVLRQFLRDKVGCLERALASGDVAMFSHPQWWIDKVRQAYPGAWETLLEINNSHPPMTLRVNTRKLTTAEYLQRLFEQGVAAQQIGGAAIRLAQPMHTDALPGFTQGWVSVQDAGAQRAAELLNAKPGMRVLDACSAPGGKAAHLLETQELCLTALDIDRGRLDKVQQTFSRLGLTGICVQGDASQPQQWWDGQPYDRILADVPCTASGVVRRHPDIKWLRRAEDIQGFAAQQAAILDALWRLLAQGGKLLYATCSIFREENHMQIEAFLQRTPDAFFENRDDSDGQILPHADYDGFYYALLAKRA